MSSMHYFAALSVTLLGAILLLIHLAFKWTNGGRTGKEGMLPPGSRGLPLLGETLEFFAASPTLELVPFFKRRLERFGPIFRTNIIGEDLIVSLDPELNALVLQQEERGFQIWYPSSFMRVLGASNIVSALGPLHRHLRNLVLRLFGPEALRLVLLHDVQRSARDELRSWLDRPDVEVKTATSRGRQNVMKILKRQLDERRSAAKRKTVDFFDLVIDELNKPNPIMNENVALDLLLLLLFASHETTSIGLTAIIKFLTDNPKALQELTDEHEKIVERRVDPDSDITWEEYKSMKFTSHVIHESLRMANIAPVVFRQANHDVHIKGYTIPEGSKIMICPSAAHLNSDVYEDPLAFNPWRWKDTPEPVGGSKDFMAFGIGLRLCVGADFAKLQMAMFLHCLVTNYRWKAISKGKMMFYPGLRFPDGFRIQLLTKA